MTIDATLAQWIRSVANELDQAGCSSATTLAERYGPGFPAAYRAGATAADAAADISKLVTVDDANSKVIRLYRRPQDSASRLRLKLYSREAVALSDVVPAFENFGFRVIGELATSIAGGAEANIQRFILELAPDIVAADVLTRADGIAPAIAATIAGRSEDDGLNRLVVTGGLSTRSVHLLRAFYHYLRQTGMTYSLETYVGSLHRAQGVTGSLIALFDALHDPDIQDGVTKAGVAERAIAEGLEAVTAIDEDHILRRLYALVRGLQRTNFFVADEREAHAFKFDSEQLHWLTPPIPWREIWVYSSRVEGIHLRSGPVARGGLRWSDRRDDFRTEILGLMKAQRVKNAVIVPAGAKGGFYPKALPDPAIDRDGWLAEGREAYRIFIRALLSVTDNVVEGQIVPPARVVRRDGDDSYLVVAADKGTATFSDIANAIAIEQGFWLGDAFASGGSNGYDHKAMGITARGAWVGVQRHFAEQGIDVQAEPVTVAGCGDMSGDVFGNGMLLSKAMRLVAAFDHRHIFLDPSADAATGWAERARLFELSRSSWDDYDRSKLSAGGGIFSRSLKRIPLSPEVANALAIDAEWLEPAALISAILKAPVDLLWFGGIGSYIKAGHEGDGDVGDPANDHLRVRAEEVRARVIGEGANLAVTQAARIAIAANGGRLNADFIDNSAGVDCSDNEVNIKIVLNQAMAAGHLEEEERNRLLVSMTDDVADIVLENNRLQMLGLSIAEAGGTAAVPSYCGLIEMFEAGGRLDRKVEGLAPSEQLLRRAQEGRGLTRPEIATLSATAKLTIQDTLERGQLVTEDDLGGELLAAFPAAMLKWDKQAVLDHPLRRQIVATKVANRLVNRLGMLAPFELIEEENCSVEDMAWSFLVAERLFDMPALWAEIETAAMSEVARVALFSEVATGLREHMADLLRRLPARLAPGQTVALLRDGLQRLTDPVDTLIADAAKRRASIAQDRLLALGAPPALASRVVLLAKLDGAIGLAAVANSIGAAEAEVAEAFVLLGKRLGVDWVQATAARLSPSDPWERLVVAGVARDLQHLRLEFLAAAESKDVTAYVELWLTANTKRIEHLNAAVCRARAASQPSSAMLAKLAGQARGVLATPMASAGRNVPIVGLPVV